ncbi:MAG: cell surface protein SprA [Salibacteraceae bacterium]
MASDLPAELTGSHNPWENYLEVAQVVNPVDTPPVSDSLKFKFKDGSYSPFENNPKGGLYLEPPSNLQEDVEYDPATGTYQVKQTIGDSLQFRAPTKMSFEEYLDYNADQGLQEYWKEKSDAQAKENSKRKEDKKNGFAPEIKIENEKFSDIFGGNTIDIRPSGSAELIFGINVSRTQNPVIPVRQQRVTTFDFDEKIQLNVIGNVGEKLKITTNYNTEATFDFENQMKLEYTGYDDEIIQKIELGNVNLPLEGSLITGSQSLFGVKTQLKFGRLLVTSVYSQQRGKKTEIETKGGAQVSEFEVKADNYEVNRHFFLGHFFRDQYEEAVANPPILRTSVNITRIEVWVTNTRTAFNDTRNILAFQDLGEAEPHIHSPNVTATSPNSSPTDNNANNLYSLMSQDAQIRGFISSIARLNALNYENRIDYQKIEIARKLSESEYYVHRQLGYISLNQQLNQNQVLAVAYEYTVNGRRYQVGELSTDGVTGTDAIYAKMLRSTELNTRIPMWDLMMKNVYSIGAYQVKQEGFKLDVWYLSRETGVDINFLPSGPETVKGLPLIQVMGMDRVNTNGAAVPDGLFDFLDNPTRITINPANGRIYFTKLEPFGSGLRDAFGPNFQSEADIYAFDSLYTNTQPNAQVQFPRQNRFTLKGRYESSSSSQISLNALNVPRGSVTVTAGGQKLVENVDYTVDYTLGRVTILNQGVLESGTPVKVSLESNSLFNIQTKTLFATRFDYKVNDDFTLGGTIMNLSERPLTQKINVGNEPISNTMVGFDWNYKKDSRLLTNLVDKLPLIETKEKSSITFTGEYARLIPGHSRAIGRDGTSYIDDFEGSQTAIDLRAWQTWVLASTPQGQRNLFPEGNLANDLAFNYNRARLAWYVIDPLYFRNIAITPGHINGNDNIQSNHFQREVFESEVFPTRQLPNGTPNNIRMFDMAFYPTERGPYNYDVEGGTYSAGQNANGELRDPESRWGGIMRSIESSDFEAANIEFIQFWLMDPFNEDYIDPETVNGELIFNLGNISEDILRDGYKSFENSLPTTAAASADLTNDTLSQWGRVVLTQAIVNAFDLNNESREFQDVGLDGLRDEEERIFFQESFIDRLENTFGTGSQAYQQGVADPSADNYNFHRDDDYDAAELNVLERYKLFNGLEGNSPTAEQSQQENNDGFPTLAIPRPNVEDITNDNTLDEVESYYQYRVRINPNQMVVGQNHITNVLNASPTVSSGDKRNIKWYQFKIPIRDPEEIYGSISDFRAIRFMRIYVRGFEKPIYLRFARLELLRGEWRRYDRSLDVGNEILETEDETEFNIIAVNIEENSRKTPVNYVLPPDIAREINIGTTNLQQLNEQSLGVQVCNLEDGKAKAAYRNLDLDVRMYRKLKMFIHAEEANEIPLNNGDLRAFIRLGTDFDENYYEYEIPLQVTLPGNYDGENEDAQRQVWPDANSIEIVFSKLKEAKLRRNSALGSDGGVIDIARLQSRYVESDGRAKIYVVGNPNLSTVKTIMLGVRNPAATLGETMDDGLAKCAEVWFNELRLTDFNENGGWAAISRVTARLADFATVSLAGSISTPGWGSIEKKVSERQQETITTFDASTTIQLGKLLPEKAGLQVPMYLGFSEAVSTPQFDPLNPDIELADELDILENEEAAAVKKRSQSYTKRRSINFTNVRKEKNPQQKESHFYDISNLSGTYSYSEVFRRDINTEFESTKDYRGGLNYNYAPRPKNYRPFSKVKLVRKSKLLQPIRDFNLYTSPKQLGFRTDITRNYKESQARNNNPGFAAPVQVFVDKQFNWTRTYDLKYDLTRSLKFDFNAQNAAFIGEEQGTRINRDIDTEEARDDYQQFVDTVLFSLRNFGETSQYRHTANMNYTLPFNKFPLTNWINSTARYSSSYTWDRAPLADETLGGTIQNTQQVNMNTTFNMLTLYNKVGYLKKINQNRRRPKPKKAEPLLKSQQTGDTANGKEDKEKSEWAKKILENSAKALMMVKNVSVTFSQNRGIYMPGYTESTTVLGLNDQFSAPGVGFIFGQQSGWRDDTTNFAEYAGDRGWLVRNTNVNNPYNTTFTENLNIRASLEPAKDLRIELTANRTQSQNFTQFYRWVPDSLANDPNVGQFFSESPLETGSYSVSIITWQTAFRPGESEEESNLFQNFLDNRQTISSRLSEQNEDSDGAHNDTENQAGYSFGYGATSQDVLIPAFLSAYTGSPASAIGLKTFSKLPAPNWRVTYNGLSKIEFFKKYVQTFTVNHAYRSTFNVAGYNSNLLYSDRNNDGLPDENGGAGIDQNGNFIPEYQIAKVTISEQFSPLVNFAVTWQTRLPTRFEVKKDRNLSMSFANNQLTEVKGNEYVAGAGYTFEGVKLPFELRRGTPIRSDLKLRADVSVRNNRTIIRRVTQEVPDQITAGQRIIAIKFTADYQVGTNLNVRLFYDRTANRPFLSTAFPTSNTNAGISIRFTLSS